MKVESLTRNDRAAAELGRSRPIALSTPPEADKGEGEFRKPRSSPAKPRWSRRQKNYLHLRVTFQHSSFEWMEVVMAHRVCPWWLGYFLASPLRRLMLEPEKVVLPLVREGMTVLEPGPGMGFFTVELARLVGASGRVVAVEIQPKMLAGLKRRVSKAGLLNRVDARLVSPGSLGVTDLRGSVDFTLACAVVHELSDAGRFFAEVVQASKPEATLLLVEPAGHVKEAEFQSELEAASRAGLSVADHPSVRRSHAALLTKDS